MTVRVAPLFAVGLGLVFLASGCSQDANIPKLGKVYGKVTYKGQAVDGGRVVFTPTGGQGGDTGHGATGEIGTDGSYELTTFNTGDGAILAQHVVTVVVPQKGEMPKPDATGRIEYKLPKNVTPSKYATADKSPLRCTVAEGSQKFDIELKD